MDIKDTKRGINVKKEDIEIFDLTTNQEKSKKTKAIKKEIDYSQTNITIKKVIVFVSGILFVFASVYGVLKYTKYLNPIKNILIKNTDTNSSNNPIKNDSEVTLKTIAYNLGAIINNDVSYYVEKNPDGIELSLNLSNVPIDAEKKITKAGEYSYQVNSNTKEFTGKIIVTDNIAPTVQTKVAYIAVGSQEIKPELFFREVSDNSGKYLSQITNLNEINFNVAKEYLVKISISDESGNETKVEEKLVVLGSEYANLTPLQDLNVSYNDKNDLNWNQVITEKFTIATTNTSTIYMNAINRINRYDWFSVLNSRYPGAKINDDDIMILYNQHDLVVGLTMRANLTFQGQTKHYYFSY